MVPSAPDWEALQRAVSGDVVLPGSPDYESTRKPAIANFHDIRPQAVVLCRTPQDVSETILFARESGLRTAARSGGHCFAGRSSTEGIIIDVTPMRSVSVSDGVATVGAGARLGEVYDTLAQYGLTIPGGCGPSVGISGLALGGGLVILGTLPAPATTGFHLLWPHTHAAALISAWQAWAPAVPDELAASLLATASRDPERPPVVNVFGSMLGTEDDTAQVLDELVTSAGADPTSASYEHASLRETKRYLAKLGDAMAEGDDQLGETLQGEPSPQGQTFS